MGNGFEYLSTEAEGIQSVVRSYEEGCITLEEMENHIVLAMDRMTKCLLTIKVRLVEGERPTQENACA